MNFYELVHRYLPEKYNIGGEYYHTGRYLFITVHLFLFNCIYFLTTYSFLVGVPYTLEIYGYFGITMFIFMRYLIYKNISPFIVIQFFAVTVYLMVTASVLVTGGTDSATYTFYFIIPLFTVAMDNLKYTLIVSIIILTSSVYFYLSPHIPLLIEPQNVKKFYLFHYIGLFGSSISIVLFQIYLRILDIAELKNIRKQLEETNKRLQKFAIIASHDLKTPLKTITNFTRIIYSKYESNIEDQDKELFKIVMKDIQNLNKLIVDLLEFSNITKNLSPAHPVNLNLLLDDIQHALHYQIQESKAKLTVEDLPVVLAHYSLIYQLFLNLISNSLKFRTKNLPTTIKLYTTLIDENFVEICVEDNGIGIPDEFKDDVFNPFMKNHPNSKIEGHGIGLAICSEIIAFYNGTIYVEKMQKPGTCIKFKLPIYQ